MPAPSEIVAEAAFTTTLPPCPLRRTKDPDWINPPRVRVRTPRSAFKLPATASNELALLIVPASAMRVLRDAVTVRQPAAPLPETLRVTVAIDAPTMLRSF